jgi:hypothetical protein
VVAGRKGLAEQADHVLAVEKGVAYLHMLPQRLYHLAVVAGWEVLAEQLDHVPAVEKGVAHLQLGLRRLYHRAVAMGPDARAPVTEAALEIESANLVQLSEREG